MKKLSLFLSTVGGALGGYLLSNKSLRTNLSKSKSADEALRTFSTAVKKDSQKVAKEAKDFLHSDAVQSKINDVKKMADSKLKDASNAVKNMAEEGKKKVTKSAKKTSKNVKKKTDTVVKKTRKQIAAK